MKIVWNEVTSYSQILAIVLALAIFGLGFYLGTLYQAKAYENAQKELAA